MTQEITRDEWLAALNTALQQPDGAGLTSAELGERLGVGNDTLMQRLRALKAQGRLCVERGYRVSIDGVRRHVPVYRIVQ